MLIIETYQIIAKTASLLITFIIYNEKTSRFTIIKNIHI